jgi:hypothetical protein
MARIVVNAGHFARTARRRPGIVTLSFDPLNLMRGAL